MPFGNITGGNGAGSIGAPTVAETTTDVVITDALQHQLQSISFTPATAGYYYVSWFIQWKPAGSTQGLNIAVLVDGTNVPNANANAQVSNDPNDVVYQDGGFYTHLTAATHTIVIKVAEANAAGTYTIHYNQFAVR